MKVTISGNFIHIESDKAANNQCACTSMTLEQYAKHARDPAFAAAVTAAAKVSDAQILTAIVQPVLEV